MSRRPLRRRRPTRREGEPPPPPRSPPRPPPLQLILIPSRTDSDTSPMIFHTVRPSLEWTYRYVRRGWVGEGHRGGVETAVGSIGCGAAVADRGGGVVTSAGGAGTAGGSGAGLGRAAPGRIGPEDRVGP